MLHSKFVASKIVKAAMIALLILSCLPSSKADEVDTLIQKLKDKNWRVQQRAAEALGEIKDARAVEPLIAALKDENLDIRWRAADALGEIKDARAVEHLIAVLKNEDWNIRRHAADALGKIGAPAVEPLIAALKDKHWNIRRNAADALGVIKDARAVEPLIAALKDEDSDVRKRAAAALGEIKDARAVEPLIAALKDENLDIRWRAADALGEIKDARAVEPLIAALKDKDKYVRQGVAEALGKIKDARAVEPLIAALKDEYSYVQRKAVGALGNIGIPSMIKALKDPKRAVNTLKETLVYWDFPAAEMLSSLGWIPESDSDRIHFWVGLRNSEKLKENWNTTKDVLLKDVKSYNCLTIENALYAFVAIGKEEIIPKLIETLNEKGDKAMAEAYLNCGHSGLAEAAREWVSSHGYSISTGSGKAPVGWGSW